MTKVIPFQTTKSEPGWSLASRLAVATVAIATVAIAAVLDAGA
jgi:hypothetical protein